MKKKYKKARIFGGLGLVALFAAVILMIVGMSSTVQDIEEVAVSRTPEVVLANAGVEDQSIVSLPVAYYDQRADECVNIYEAGLSDVLENRQFEWSKCEYYNTTIEKGLVEFGLGDDYLPVAVGGQLTPNRGVKGENFARWYNAVDGKSTSYAGVLQMNYRSAGAEFTFYSDDFYPLDEAEFSAGDMVNMDGHNHLFTMNFAVPFTVVAEGNEYFEVKADDDTFVYVGDKLVLDMGGIHAATTGRFLILESGEIYAATEGEDYAFSGVSVEAKDNSIVRIFHADRDSNDSVFNLKFRGMNLSVMNTTLANQKDGVQIAYDPMDPSYVAPLGESAVFRPDTSKGLIVLATIEGVLVVVFAFLAAGVIRFVVKTRKQ